MSVFPDLDAQLAEIRRENKAAFLHLNQRLDTIMAKVDDVAAQIAANTTVINNMAAAITAIDEGHSTVSDEIAALKAQIAAGQAPDFTAVDAALAAQTTAVSAAAAMVPTP